VRSSSTMDSWLSRTWGVGRVGAGAGGGGGDAVGGGGEDVDMVLGERCVRSMCMGVHIQLNVCVVMWGGRSFGLHTPKVT
jgi:hypothetical protein